MKLFFVVRTINILVFISVIGLTSSFFITAQDIDPTTTPTIEPSTTEPVPEFPTATAAPETPTPTIDPPTSEMPTITPTIETPTQESVLPSETLLPESLTPTDDAATVTTTLEINTDTPTLELTISETPSPTETTITTSVETATPVSTATLGVPMIYVQGIVSYQSRQSDNSGIQIEIWNGNRVLLNTATSNGDGVYSVLVPEQEFYWLVIAAPLHRHIEIGVWPGETLPELVLAGGDINGDGCVGSSDLARLTAQFELPGSTSTDVNGDGITEAADLAILAGNFDPTCEALLTTPTQEVVTTTPEMTPSATVEVTPTTEAPTLSPTPEAAATAIEEVSTTPDPTDSGG